MRVRLLGRPQVTADDERATAQPRGRKSWAVLARVAMADRPPLRRELAESLFSEADDPLAALRWSLADLRRSLGLPGSLRGDPLRLSRDEVWLDVWALEDGALRVEDLRGALLDGMDVANSPTFDSWLLLARAETDRRCREETRLQALRLLAAGAAAEAVVAAERGVAIDPLDESAHELLLRALTAAGRTALAAAHLAAAERTFAHEGLPLSPAVRAAAVPRTARPSAGIRAGVAAAALLQAGRAALDAGAADGGVETLRRAADDAERAGDQAILAEVLGALGSALVHAVRGADGEGAVMLHRALRSARAAGSDATAADVLRELAFVDLQAGRHGSASRALQQAGELAAGLGDDALAARIVAVHGMNEGDLGRHRSAVRLLTRSAELAGSAGQARQRIWSLGVLARSLLLLDRTADARAASEASMEGARAERWNAYLPWPQAIHAECAARAGEWATAAADAEQAFALACELGDPCWEGMSARALGLVAAHAGDEAAGWEWTLDARTRCDRVPDRYVWVSAYVSLAQIQIARSGDPGAVPHLAARLYDEAVRTDLPEFQAWAMVHRAESGDRTLVPRARAAARDLDSPSLRRRAGELAA